MMIILWDAIKKLIINLLRFLLKSEKICNNKILLFG